MYHIRMTLILSGFLILTGLAYLSSSTHDVPSKLAVPVLTLPDISTEGYVYLAIFGLHLMAR